LLAKASGCAAACSTRLWIVGPTWRERDVASLFEQLRPAILAVWQQPQTVHEHDGHPARCICSVDLLLVAVPKGVKQSGHRGSPSRLFRSSQASAAFVANPRVRLRTFATYACGCLRLM
jgi:hypothetical protein